MKFISVLLICTFTITAIFSCWVPLMSQTKGTTKLTLGVIPFHAAGVKQHEAYSLSTRLHSELVKTGRFRVIEIETLEEMLRQHGIQQAGFCTDQECIINVGNWLNARLMVAGTVGKVGDIFTVDVRLVDIETRRVAWAKTGERSRIGDLLSFMNEIALELAAPISKDRKIETPQKGKNWLIWIGGAILVGGGVTALLLASDKDKKNSEDVIGTPPEPPDTK